MSCPFRNYENNMYWNKLVYLEKLIFSLQHKGFEVVILKIRIY